jgi:peptidoglycan/xylan/chitin deacetylase (PgdA/CDA1 family)
LITFDDGFADTFAMVGPILERHGMCATMFLIGREHDKWEGQSLVRHAQLKERSAQINVGSHTVNHLNLPASEESVIEKEICDSKRELNEAGYNPTAFAYPFGYYDDRVRRAAARFFQIAFTCDEGLNDLSTDPMRMRRTMVHPGDTTIEVLLRARYGRNPLIKLKSRIRLRTRLRAAAGMRAA